MSGPASTTSWSASGTSWTASPRHCSWPEAAVSDLARIDAEVVDCRRCPRLVTWREDVAAVRRRAYADEQYWGRPLAGFGDPTARIVVLGLAPAAHGGNRTGRVFTGDRSGDWLFAALHRAGLANQATSTHVGDGLALRDARIVAAVRCAPPANRPTPVERDTCGYWLDAELNELAGTARVIVVLGGFAWDAGLRSLGRSGFSVPRPRPVFGHGREVELNRGTGERLILLGCFHVSQQNTFTGRLTAVMLDEVFSRALRLC